MTLRIRQDGKWMGTAPDGTEVIYRAPYQPGHFTVPSTEEERLTHIRGLSSADILAEHDGELHTYREIRRFTRDGKDWILMVAPGEYALEVEATTTPGFRIRCLPPEQAWELARELDQNETRYPILIATEEDAWIEV